MIIYSVTVSIENSIEKEWLHWMQEKHIPDVMNTGYFLEYNINRLLDPAPENGGTTYNIQYTCSGMQDLLEYQKNEGPALRDEHTERYKDRFVAFRTLLERI